MKISVRNHGLIEKASVELVPGLNLLIGPTGSGKSTLFSGIQRLVFNEPGDQFITDGKDSAIIRIMTDEATVTRKRDPNAKEYKTVYQIDGKSYSKVGRGAFQQVMDKLNIREVNLLDTKLRPNFSPQFATPFLVTDSPPKIFEFLTTSDESVNLTKILHQMRADLDIAKVERKEKEAAYNATTRIISKQQSVLAGLKDFPAFMEKVLSIEDSVKDLDRLKVLFLELSFHRDRARALAESIKSMRALPDKVDDQVIRVMFNEITTLKPKLSAVYATEKKAKALLTELRITQSKIKLSQQIPEIEPTRKKKEDLGSLTTTLQSIETSRETITNLQNQIDCHRKVGELPRIDYKVTYANKLAELLKSLSETQVKVKELQQEAKQNKGELAEIQEKLSEFDICPLCGTEICKGGHNG